jgi:hypothetical protein
MSTQMSTWTWVHYPKSLQRTAVTLGSFALLLTLSRAEQH